MLHAWQWLRENEQYEADALVLLFPTNPLRQVSHVEECVEKFYTADVTSVVTVNESPAHYTPYWTLVRDDDGVVRYFGGKDIRKGYSSRQDFPQVCYAKNDLVFVIRPKNLLEEPSSLYGDKVELLVTDRKFDGDINTLEEWDLTLHRFLHMTADRNVPETR